MPGPVELRHRLQPRPRVRRVRLRRPPRLLVQRRHRQARAHARALGDLEQQVLVAQQQRRLGQDRARVREVPHRLPDPAHELVAPLDPLVRVGVRAHRDVLALPRRPRQLGPQHLRHVDLDDDLAVEVTAGVEVEVLVRRTREAKLARMRAAPIRVDRPGKRHARRLRHAVERRLRVDLVETGVEGLRRVEMAHDGLAVARQAPLPLPLDLLIFPTHERMFAYRVAGPHSTAARGALTDVRRCSHGRPGTPSRPRGAPRSASAAA